MAEDQSLTADDARNALLELADPERARSSAWFFKTEPGGYGEGDLFRGVRVPEQRRLARRFWRMPLTELEALLRSSWHEDRLLALLCLVRRFERTPADRPAIRALYLDNLRYVNNWDLVDSSAEYLLGATLDGGDLRSLDRLADSATVWERRVAMLATFHFTKRGDFAPAIRIAERLRGDPHDLIHKAVGWMLREVGERDREAEEQFLRAHYRAMPRTMLRYAIEKFPEALRQAYLKGSI